MPRLVALLALMCFASLLPAAGPSSPLKLDAAGRQWVEQSLQAMSIEEKAGQLLMPSSLTRPSELKPASLKAHRRLVRRYHPGGWLVLGGEVPTARRLIDDLEEASSLPLLVAVDGEGGLGYRLSGATRFPRAMALAAGSSPAEIREVARVTAEEALAAGIHVSFYPVVDVNTNPENPIINIRSFGDDPARVAELSGAYIEGLQDAGMLATAKHFPGHGDTTTNSHLSLPVVSGNRARLDLVELLPFRRAIESGVGLVMTGHLAVPTIDSDLTVPATLSQSVLDGLLRDELGYEGLVVTDALNMKGLPLSLGAGEVAIRAVEAGADILLMPTSVPDAHSGLVEALAAGRISQERLDASVRRILEAKAHLGLHKEREPSSPARVPAEHAELARRVMQNAVTLARDGSHLLPLRPSVSSRPLVVSMVSSSRSPGSQWAAQIRARRPASAVQTVPSTFSELSREVLLERARASDVVLLALHLRVSDSSGRIALSRDQLAAMEGLAASSTPLVTAVFGSPYVLGDLPSLPTLIFTFEEYSEAERAAVRAIFGERPFRGRLPVTLPGIAPAGHGLVQ